MITLDNVCFSYGEGLVLDHLNYTFERGNRYTIEGPNGCGKSTLFRILLGLDYPTEGRYLFDGREISGKTMKDPGFRMDFHRKIGFVFQDPEVQLFCSSVEDEILFGPAQLGLPEEEVRDRVEKYIQMFGLVRVRDRAPFHLSGGEKKRVALASVLAMDPAVLVLDEPMNGLDEKCQGFFLEYIRAAGEGDRIVICATHDRTLRDAVDGIRVRMTADHRILPEEEKRNG